ncbi:hypothetical protein NQ176_g7066 [Zarea fungicola]|uniref:Uncharacterized protein n=1 Tax=Zarea fungicola TaxID=93591 RepID=A0ACC1N2D2_9HYPO|nr:hypothetical protein NQ176_g7066 [Lecanicillium fungicola]
MLRDTFRHVLSRIRCVFCDTVMTVKDAEAMCGNGHAFATCVSSGIPIMAPGISRVCAVCGLRCLKPSELEKLSKEFLDDTVKIDTAAELCGGCGGKFIV